MFCVDIQATVKFCVKNRGIKWGVSICFICAPDKATAINITCCLVNNGCIDEKNSHLWGKQDLLITQLKTRENVFK